MPGRVSFVFLYYIKIKLTIIIMQGVKKTGVRQGSSAVYGMGFIGAVIYFIQHATGFWMGVLGVLKAMVWPAILVYEFLNYLNK